MKYFVEQKPETYKLYGDRTDDVKIYEHGEGNSIRELGYIYSQEDANRLVNMLNRLDTETSAKVDKRLLQKHVLTI